MDNALFDYKIVNNITKVLHLSLIYGIIPKKTKEICNISGKESVMSKTIQKIIQALFVVLAALSMGNILVG